jgi:hypothetical protein
MTRQSRTKHIGDKHDVVIDANWAAHFGLVAKVACRAHQIWMRVTHLIFAQAPTTKFVDQRTTRKAMVDDATKGFTMIVGKRKCTQPTLSSLYSHDGER